MVMSHSSDEHSPTEKHVTVAVHDVNSDACYLHNKQRATSFREILMKFDRQQQPSSNKLLLSTFEDFKADKEQLKKQTFGQNDSNKLVSISDSEYSMTLLNERRYESNRKKVNSLNFCIVSIEV